MRLLGKFLLTALLLGLAVVAWFVFLGGAVVSDLSHSWSRTLFSTSAAVSFIVLAGLAWTWGLPQRIRRVLAVRRASSQAIFETARFAKAGFALEPLDDGFFDWLQQQKRLTGDISPALMFRLREQFEETKN